MALLWKMICNLGDHMSFCHPVWGCTWYTNYMMYVSALEMRYCHHVWIRAWNMALSRSIRMHMMYDCGVLRCVAVCCGVLQCVAVCCSVLQYVAVCCSVLKCVAACCSMLQCVAVCCRRLQYAALCCSMLHYATVCCSVQSVWQSNSVYLMSYIGVLI